LKIKVAGLATLAVRVQEAEAIGEVQGEIPIGSPHTHIKGGIGFVADAVAGLGRAHIEIRVFLGEVKAPRNTVREYLVIAGIIVCMRPFLRPRRMAYQKEVYTNE
jgi:hypothetical protein